MYTKQEVIINSLGVGLENGEFFILDISENILIGGTEEEKVIFEAQYDGEIVDLFYKEY
ncbi:MAG: hypothetical protein WCR61_07385 [Bacteroidales bacterium]|nr:hypothetical protein [Bacteroidales bacterium]